MGRVVVVTDSTANLPSELVEEYGIPIIPLNVHWGQEMYKDGITLDSETFYRWLQEREDFPTTSQPSVGEFIEFFQEVAETYQADTIIGIFISSVLSGTFASATQAKEQLPELRIEVVDSYSVSMGVGFQVLVAARAIREGASVDEALAQVCRTRDNTHLIFVVDTLEYLHRGGRIGGAARLLGTALNLKPVLAIESGQVEALGKVRSRRKSLRELMKIAEERLNGYRPVELAVVQAVAEGEAALLMRQVSERFKPGQLYTSILTPVVGTHGGPGTVGVVFYTEK